MAHLLYKLVLYTILYAIDVLSCVLYLQTVSCSKLEESNGVVCSYGRSILQGATHDVILSFDFKNLGPSFTTINITANTWVCSLSIAIYIVVYI